MRRRLVAVTAAVTAVAVTVGTVGVWFEVTSASREESGTLSSLRAAGTAGAWHAVAPGTLDRTVNVSEAPSTVDASAVGGDDVRSVVLQLIVDASTPTDVTVYGAGEPAPTVPTMSVASGTTSASAFVRLGSSRQLVIAATSAAHVRVTATAYVTPAGTTSHLLDPGGSQAVDARAVVDSRTGLGGAVADGTPIPLDPSGLGAVPTGGVQAVWLQIALQGGDASVALGTGVTAPVVARSRAGGDALVLAPLDENGAVQLVPRGTPERLSVALVGWVASQTADTDAAVIAGGVVPVPATSIPVHGTEADLPSAVVGSGGVALYSLSATSPAMAVAGANDPAGAADAGIPSAAAISGAANALVAVPVGSPLTMPAGAAVDSLTLLGIFPVPRPPAAGATPTSQGELAVRILQPATSSNVDLAQTHGLVTIGGRITGTMSIRSVHVLLGDRYVGAATVRLDGDGITWSLQTSAPGGTHTLTARVADWSGATAEAHVTFTAVEPPTEQSVSSRDVVVLDPSQIAALTGSTPTSLTFTGDLPVRVGAILAAPSTAQTPEGLLRRVLSIERQADHLVLTTSQAPLTDAVLQVDDEVHDAVLTNPAATTRTTASTTADAADPAGVAATTSTVRVRDAVAHRTAPLVITASSVSVPLPPVGLTASTELSYTEPTKPDEARTDWSAKASVNVRLASGEDLSDPTDGHGGLTAERSVGDSPSSAVEIGATVTSAYRIQATASVDLQIGLSWAWGLPRPDLRVFEASVTTTRQQTTVVQGFGKVSSTHATDGERLRILLGRVPMTIPIPWTLSLYLVPSVEVTFSAEAETSTKLQETFVDTLGFRWDHGKTSAITRSQQTQFDGDVSLHVGLEADAKVALRIEAMADEALGAYLGPQLELTLTASSTTSVPTTASATPSPFQVKATLDLDGVAGAELKVLDVTLATFEVSFQVHSWPLLKPHDDTGGGPGASPPPELHGTGTTAQASAGGIGRATVVMFDVSGSMAGEKLQAAKQAMRNVVSTTPVGSELGVWSYPGQGGGLCDAGGWAIPVQPIIGVGALMARIDLLQAGGDTPTAEALQAVAHDLIAQGLRGATVVLISDGESTCQPPCDVATQLRAQGFDLRVAAVGFETSAAGADELRCIAQATGGKYLDATTQTITGDTITALTAPQLSLRLTAPPAVASGLPQVVQATISNTSNSDATDVHISLDVTGSGPQIRTSPAADQAVGNLPAGDEVTATFTLTQSSTDAPETTTVRADAWATNAALVSADASYRATSPAATPQPDPAWLEPLDGAVDASPAATPGQSRAAAPTTSGSPTPVASAGTTQATALHLATASWTAPLDLSRLAGTAPRSVLLTTGAQEAGLVDFMSQCVQHGCSTGDSDAAVMFAAVQRLDVSSELEAAWQAVNTPSAIARRGGAHAPVLVTAYPDVFGTAGQRSCSAAVDADSAGVGHVLVGMLNEAVQASVARARAAGAEVYFVPGTADVLTAGHTLCDGDPMASLNPSAATLTVDERAEPLLDAALISWTNGRTRVAPTATALRQAADPSRAPGVVGWACRLTTDAFMRPITVDMTTPRETAVLSTGRSFSLSAPGFASGAPVAVSLDGGATVLGVVFARADGVASGRFTVPTGQQTGRAALTVTGTGAAGPVQVLSRPLGVASPVPLGIASLTLACVVLLLMSLALVGLALMRRRRPDRC